MEYNKTVNNPLLAGAIQLLKAEDTPDHRNMFLNEMIKAKMLTPAIVTPAPEADSNGEYKLTQENKLQFPMITAPDGKHFFMAFTDLPELKKWKDEETQQFFAATIDDFGGMLLRPDGQAAGFVINPFSENIIVPIQMLAGIMSARMGNQGTAPVQAASVPDSE